MGPAPGDCQRLLLRENLAFILSVSASRTPREHYSTKGLCTHRGFSNSTKAKAGGLGGSFKSMFRMRPYCSVTESGSLVRQKRHNMPLHMQTRPWHQPFLD